MSAPVVRITEQPTELVRFRYESELKGRSPGSIAGANSTQDKKTFPTIEVVGYSGPYAVLVSLVTKDEPFRAHPHGILKSEGRACAETHDNRDKSLCYAIADTPTLAFAFGIVRVKKSPLEIIQSLKEKKRINVDPFKAGFDHMQDPTNIELNAVRLCFQVLLPDADFDPVLNRSQLNRYKVPLKPVVSNVIFNSPSELKISYISSCEINPLSGGGEFTLLCDKFAGQTPEVIIADKEPERNHQNQNRNEDIWEAKATIKIVHNRSAIVFSMPPYKSQTRSERVEVAVYLRRNGGPDGEERSAPIFIYYSPAGAQSARKSQHDVQRQIHSNIYPASAEWHSAPLHYLESKKRKSCNEPCCNSVLRNFRLPLPRRSPEEPALSRSNHPENVCYSLQLPIRSWHRKF